MSEDPAASPPNTTPAAAPARRGALRTALPVLFAGVLAALFYAGNQFARQGGGLDRGAPAPEFTIEKYGGGTVRLADLRGKVVVVDFWATWCEPCREELPSLVKLAGEYEGKDFVFIAANRDDLSEQRPAVGLFVDKVLPALDRYAAFADDGMAMQYKVAALPTVYFIGKDGQIVQHYRGLTSEGELRSAIEKAFAAH